MLQLLREGKEMEILWEELKTLSFSLFGTYHKYFLLTHFLEIVDRYCQYVLDYMDKAYKKDRQTYQHVADYLTEIKYMGGVAQADAIINTLLIKYLRSPALVGELSNV